MRHDSQEAQDGRGEGQQAPERARGQVQGQVQALGRARDRDGERERARIRRGRWGGSAARDAEGVAEAARGAAAAARAVRPEGGASSEVSGVPDVADPSDVLGDAGGGLRAGGGVGGMADGSGDRGVAEPVRELLVPRLVPRAEGGRDSDDFGSGRRRLVGRRPGGSGRRRGRSRRWGRDWGRPCGQGLGRRRSIRGRSSWRWPGLAGRTWRRRRPRRRSGGRLRTRRG